MTQKDSNRKYSNETKRFIKEGRGQGTGSDYMPWTKMYTHEFSSKGRATRILGVKTNRIHHFQSDNQYRAFLMFEFNINVIDIRESYPLLDIDETIDQKDDLRFEKFRDKETGEQYVITTNFLLTVKDEKGDVRHVARTVKNASELKRKLTWEKLEIERLYWEAKGVDWKVITNKQLPKKLTQNIEWIRETLLYQHDELDYLEHADHLLDHLYLKSERNVDVLLTEFEERESISYGTGLFLFRYLIATHKLTVDLTEPIKLNQPLISLIK
ncbi:TnsA endonuclease N-terminal domain-containing protein [Alkalibacillus salilacus]|uniref:Heteromeric transposase endonuclease subunit TnsA n=1 Tax=Alkalibacillus salilacus TaxID=284582 RepID=A0ABT9VIE2_9BACI|nr:TnsA endonuclease N-terminal domain-containing protein [Alkalibacillus salilacus]MDQ0160734.1 hypothetical protein [Alkalibacillus salilacus]